MLSLQWYIEAPLDFEHKNYLLLDYIQSIDNSYKLHQLNPYLLYTEKLSSELKSFLKARELFRQSTQKRSLNLNNTISWVVTNIDEPNDMKMVVDIAEYSLPLLESKIKLGYILLEKYPQVLY